MASSMHDDELFDAGFDPVLMQAPQKGLADDMADDGAAASTATATRFKPMTAFEMSGGVIETRSIRIPPHRFSPLKEHWMKIYTPLVEHMKLQVRVLPAERKIEIRTSELTELSGALQKGEDFLRAFMLGFAIRDAVALLRLDDLYLETFEIKDVKTLEGDHLSRAIGRISGKDGRTKFAIENATRTRIVLADSKVHMLGSYQNLAVARRAICDLILGSPPGKVYGRLRAMSARMNERF